MIPPLLVLFAWPFVVMVLFVRLKPAEAIALSILGGYLLLPVGRQVDLPLLPPFNKETIPALTALILAALYAGRSVAVRRASPSGARADPLPGWLPKPLFVRVLLLFLIVGGIGTAITNSDRIWYGETVLRSLKFYDGASIVLNGLAALVPLLLARRFLGAPEMHRKLLIFLVVTGLFYSLLALYEIRMSPQLNRIFYGYFPHSWSQHVRNGGFRPIVFLAHGLELSAFLSATVLASLALFRLRPPGHTPGHYLLAAGWLFMTLFLAKSLSAVLITFALAPVLLLTKPRTQLLVAAVIAGLVISYPVLRGAGLVPTNTVLSLAESINPGRASSLQTRFTNEDALLDHALERPVFGWGGSRRNRVFDEDGRTQSITDGSWIISIGLGGWMRYLAEFGLLGGSIILLALRSRRYEIDQATSGLAVILAGNLVDLIPNSSLTVLTWMIAGALLGRAEYGRISAAPSTDTGDDPPSTPERRYSRFGPEAGGPVYSRNRDRLTRERHIDAP